MIQTFIEMSRNREMIWMPRKASDYPDLDPEFVFGAVYTTEFKGKKIIVFQQRTSLNRKITESEIIVQFVDDEGKRTGLLPPTPGVKELFEEAFYQNRDTQMAELDKVVEVLTTLTRQNKLQWAISEARLFADLDEELVTSPVFVLDYRGRRFIVYKEESADSHRSEMKETISLHIVDTMGKSIKNLRFARGVELLFQTILLQNRRPDTKKLDNLIDAVVQATIRDVVEKMKNSKDSPSAQDL